MSKSPQHSNVTYRELWMRNKTIKLVQETLKEMESREKVTKKIIKSNKC